MASCLWKECLDKVRGKYRILEYFIDTHLRITLKALRIFKTLNQNKNCSEAIWLQQVLNTWCSLCVEYFTNNLRKQVADNSCAQAQLKLRHLLTRHSLFNGLFALFHEHGIWGRFVNFTHEMLDFTHCVIA